MRCRRGGLPTYGTGCDLAIGAVNGSPDGAEARWLRGAQSKLAPTCTSMWTRRRGLDVGAADSVGTVSEGLTKVVRRLDERVVRDADVRASHWYGPPPETSVAADRIEPPPAVTGRTTDRGLPARRRPC